MNRKLMLLFTVVMGNPSQTILDTGLLERTILKFKEWWWDKDIEDLQAKLEDFVKPFEESEDTGPKPDV